MKACVPSLRIVCLAILILAAPHIQGAGPLPEFTYRGVALHPKDLAWIPTGDLEHPALIKMEGRVKNPLGRYYMYCAPHKHEGIGVAYSDSIEGPWTEYKGNPVVEAAAAPDIRWIEEKGIRCVWLAHSKDAENWTQLKTPLVEPIEGENNDAYGPSLLRWQGRNFIVYQDHTAWRGGNIKYVEVDHELHSVGSKGERFVLMDPPPELDERYRGGEFYREGNTVYLITGVAKGPRIVGYATAQVGDAMPERKGNEAAEEKAPAKKQPPQRSSPRKEAAPAQSGETKARGGTSSGDC